MPAPPFGARAITLHATDPEPSRDCLIEHAQRIEAHSPVAAPFARIAVERDSSVHAGLVLVQLDSSVESAALRAVRQRAESDADVRVAQARVDQACEEFRRREDVRAESSSAMQDRDESLARTARGRSRIGGGPGQPRPGGSGGAAPGCDAAPAPVVRSFCRRRDREVAAAGCTGLHWRSSRSSLRLAATRPLRVEVVLPGPCRAASRLAAGPR